jgi:hypothetical protein
MDLNKNPIRQLGLPALIGILIAERKKEILCIHGNSVLPQRLRSILPLS